MNDLLLHPHTRERLEIFLDEPSHALLMIGPTGSGKSHLSHNVAEMVLGVDNFADYPYGRTVGSIDGKAIGIEPIRELEKFLSLKVPIEAKHSRLVLIHDAHLLTLEAQNALLKTLEEPPSGTILILTASHKQALLPTIQSRMQAINVTRPEQSDTEEYFAKLDFDIKSIKQAYAISGGLPGLMHALLNEQEHPLVQATAKARQLLSQTAYERLASVDELAKQKTLAINVLFILQQMAHVSLLSAQGPAARKWQNVLKASYQTEESLKLNTQPKLALSNLMLNL